MAKRQDEPTRNPARRAREFLAYRTQAELGADLGVSQAAVSDAERQDKLSAAWRARLLDLVRRKHSGQENDVQAILDGGRDQADARPGREAHDVKIDWEAPAYDPIEREAWPWAMQFRNHTLIDSLCSQAAVHGFTCNRITDGITLRKCRRGTGEMGSEEDAGRHPLRSAGGFQRALFRDPPEFGLRKSGTVIVFGAADRHQIAGGARAEITRQMGLDLRLHESRQPFYFGYHTVLKFLSIGGAVYRPCRYADERAIYFEDYGVILSSALRLIGRDGPRPFGKLMRRLVLVGGLHRLATGVGARLLEDPRLREAMLAGATSWPAARDLDLESDDTMGALVYRVVVRHDEWWSTVQALDILYAKRWP